MHNILVTGANGQLGSEIRAIAPEYSADQFIFTDVTELDITNHNEVLHFIESNNIQIIINCAAYTAVDKAENEFELANKINHLAVENFAKIAKAKGIQLIHISTDYIFDGTANSPYAENATPNPQSVYGQTKLAGEQAMLKINPKNSAIIRTSWVYSSVGHNFVKTMLRLSAEKKELNIVSDQIGAPTYAADLAKTILTILPKIKSENTAIYHFSNEGICTWYDFAKAIFEIKKIDIKVSPINTSAYPTPAKRPMYSVLNTQKIKNTFGISIPHWKDSLEVCLKKV